MEAPRMVGVRVSVAITLGIRATWLAVAGVPKSTSEIAPAPPGVTTAQFNCGSTATWGLSPVLTGRVRVNGIVEQFRGMLGFEPPDRKSTRLNSSHPSISYAVFCLKKKNILTIQCQRYSSTLLVHQR